MSRIYTRNNFSHSYIGVDGLYDVILTVPEINSISNRQSSPNAELLIRLKINLVQDNTGSLGGRRTWSNDDTGRNDTGFRFASWTTTAWSSFRAIFLQRAAFWDHKFWLVLSDSGRSASSYREIEKDVSIIETVNADRKYICPMVIACRFEALLTSASNAHYSLNATYLVDATGNPVPAVQGSRYILRSNDANIDSGDVYGPTVAHEIGHRLGLPHIGQITENAACIGTIFTHHSFYNMNAAACYESTVSDLSNNIMGGGFDIDWRDAVPWRVALQAITGVPLSNYTVHTSRFTAATYLPEMIDNYTPRWREFHVSALGRSAISRYLGI